MTKCPSQLKVKQQNVTSRRKTVGIHLRIVKYWCVRAKDSVFGDLGDSTISDFPPVSYILVDLNVKINGHDPKVLCWERTQQKTRQQILTFEKTLLPVLPEEWLIKESMRAATKDYFHSLSFPDWNISLFGSKTIVRKWRSVFPDRPRCRCQMSRFAHNPKILGLLSEMKRIDSHLGSGNRRNVINQLQAAV